MGLESRIPSCNDTSKRQEAAGELDLFCVENFIQCIANFHCICISYVKTSGGST